MRFWKNLESRFRPATVVLCYHRVTDQTDDLFNCCVTPKHFAEHLEVLRGLDVVHPFTRLLDAHQPHKWPGRRTAIVTFDDGYADNIFNAAPLLAQHCMPAVFYIFTGWMTPPSEAWWDRLQNAIFNAATLPPILHLPGIDEEIATSNRTTLFHSIYLLLRNRGVKAREEILARLEASPRNMQVRLTHRPMNPDELRQLAAQPGIHIGAHTVSHSYLPSLTPADQQFEIAASREWLECELGRPIKDFSYPHGGIDAGARAAAAAAGMETGVTCEERATRAGNDPLSIPRFMVHDWDGDEFAKRVAWWFTC